MVVSSRPLQPAPSRLCPLTLSRILASNIDENGGSTGVHVDELAQILKETRGSSARLDTHAFA